MGKRTKEQLKALITEHKRKERNAQRRAERARDKADYLRRKRALDWYRSHVKEDLTGTGEWVWLSVGTDATAASEEEMDAKEKYEKESDIRWKHHSVHAHAAAVLIHRRNLKETEDGLEKAVKEVISE